MTRKGTSDISDVIGSIQTNCGGGGDVSRRGGHKEPTPW